MNHLCDEDAKMFGWVDDCLHKNSGGAAAALGRRPISGFVTHVVPSFFIGCPVGNWRPPGGQMGLIFWSN